MRLNPPLTHERVQAAWHAAAMIHHPDKGGSHEAMTRLNNERAVAMAAMEAMSKHKHKHKQKQ
jgi:hypothetical protein